MQNLSADQQASRDLLKAGLEGLLNKQVDSWIAMFAEDGSMEFPFAIDGYPKKLQGRKAIADYLAGFPDRIELKRFEGPRFHFSTEPNVTVVEFSCEGHSLETGRPYNQAYIGVMTMRDGKIVNYKDYWNPLVALKALGGEDALLAFATQETSE